MSTTITYNGSTIAQVNNETKTLLTSGKWLTGNIILTDTSSGTGTLITKNIIANGNYNASSDNADGYSFVSVSVPNAISITEVANTTGTTVIVTGTEASGSSATLTTKTITLNGTYSASNDNADGYSQVVVNVPNSGGGGTSATEHTIHLEFSDETSINIPVYYNDSFISNTITSTTPNQYGQKTIDSALLDGTSWYVRPTETWEVIYDGNIDFIQETSSSENTVYPYCWVTSLGEVEIPVDSVWRVTFNGTEYRLVGKIFNNNHCIGNPKYSGETDDGSGVPFIFASTIYGAWTGAVEGENVNRTHYFKIERLVENGDTGDHIIHFVFTDETTTDIPLHYTDTFTASAITATTPTTYNNKTIETASLDGVVWYTRPQYEVLFDGSVTFQEQSPYNGIYISALSNLYPVIGETYRITIDNVVYNCVASNDGEDVQIGNPKYNYGTDDGSNVPFALYNGGYGGLNGWTELSASEHTVKIERLTTTQQQGEEEQ